MYKEKVKFIVDVKAKAGDGDTPATAYLNVHHTWPNTSNTADIPANNLVFNDGQL